MEWWVLQIDNSKKVLNNNWVYVNILIINAATVDAVPYTQEGPVGGRWARIGECGDTFACIRCKHNPVENNSRNKRVNNRILNLLDKYLPPALGISVALSKLPGGRVEIQPRWGIGVVQRHEPCCDQGISYGHGLGGILMRNSIVLQRVIIIN